MECAREETDDYWASDCEKTSDYWAGDAFGWLRLRYHPVAHQPYKLPSQPEQALQGSRDSQGRCAAGEA